MLNVCDKQQFTQITESLDEIICYGAGQQLEEFVELFDGTNVLEKCIYVADRDKSKQGTIKIIGKKQFLIISPEKMKVEHNISCAIVITFARYMEIIEFFENDDILNKLDFYCLFYFKLFEKEKEIQKKVLPKCFKIYNEPIIPKVIHYCWFGENPIPDHYKRWMESWNRFCPDYEIKEWNETNYDISKNKYMLQAYESKKWGFVPDYARLDIIYEHGGVYLDTDIELVANIDDFLYQKGFICFESETRINCGMGFGAIKGLEIIWKMREDYDKRVFRKENGELDLTPSPDLQTAFLEKNGLNRNGEYQNVKGLTVFPQKIMGGKNLFTRKIEVFPYTRAIHHFDGSWLEANQRINVTRIENGILLAQNKILNR